MTNAKDKGDDVKDKISKATMEEMLDFLDAVNAVRKVSRVNGKPMTWTQAKESMDANSPAISLAEEFLPKDVEADQRDEEVLKILETFVKYREALVEVLHKETCPKKRKEAYLTAIGRNGMSTVTIVLIVTGSVLGVALSGLLGFFIWRRFKN